MIFLDHFNVISMGPQLPYLKWWSISWAAMCTRLLICRQESRWEGSLAPQSQGNLGGCIGVKIGVTKIAYFQKLGTWIFMWSEMGQNSCLLGILYWFPKVGYIDFYVTNFAISSHFRSIFVTPFWTPVHPPKGNHTEIQELGTTWIFMWSKSCQNWELGEESYWNPEVGYMDFYVIRNRRLANLPT